MASTENKEGTVQTIFASNMLKTSTENIDERNDWNQSFFMW